MFRGVTYLRVVAEQLGLVFFGCVFTQLFFLLKSCVKNIFNIGLCIFEGSMHLFICIILMVKWKIRKIMV